ncbi:protein VACUOLELESS GAMETOPHYTES-like [Actinidia eriantha]|uniref:protein VACUOLELESS GAMETOPHYTES-like n=1 Tax=Actinidia eriantha TaxID=165200 RepID=UPI00258B0D0C|nr:protein VACUOLELESS GAMETOPHYTES-like [Actinidia eriantha]
MAPVGKKAIQHFSHPGHILSELKAETLFLCDGCKTPGQGTRYRCDPCDFDLHDYCGTCPRSLSSFMHPHPLNLVLRKAKATRQNERVCDVCRDPVEGLFYRCSDCEFDAHPLCTQLPQYIRHALHQVHPLRLQATTVAASQCAVCRVACSSWRYRCGACGFDIHIECVLAPCDPPKQRQAPPPWGPSRSAPPAATAATLSSPTMGSKSSTATMSSPTTGATAGGGLRWPVCA